MLYFLRNWLLLFLNEYLFRYARWYISEMITVDTTYLWLGNHHMMLECISFNFLWSHMIVFVVRPHWLQTIEFFQLTIRLYAMNYMFHGSLDYPNFINYCMCLQADKIFAFSCGNTTWSSFSISFWDDYFTHVGTYLLMPCDSPFEVLKIFFLLLALVYVL
jgi:hypothetical protein